MRMKCLNEDCWKRCITFLRKICLVLILSLTRRLKDGRKKRTETLQIVISEKETSPSSQFVQTWTCIFLIYLSSKRRKFLRMKTDFLYLLFLSYFSSDNLEKAVNLSSENKVQIHIYLNVGGQFQGFKHSLKSVQDGRLRTGDQRIVVITGIIGVCRKP